MRFYLDEDLSPRIAEALRRHGIDVTSSHEVGNNTLSDKDQLGVAAAERRCLVTRNARHFVRLARQAIGANEPHAGIVICPPRYTGTAVGPIVRALLRVAHSYPAGIGEYDVVYLD